jgi:hypothetical protein
MLGVILFGIVLVVLSNIFLFAFHKWENEEREDSDE